MTNKTKNRYYIKGEKAEPQFRLSNNQESKLRAMNLLNSYTFTWDELRILFELVEIEKKLSKINIKDCNEGLLQRDKDLYVELCDYVHYLVSELNSMRTREKHFFMVRFANDARGLALHLYEEHDRDERNNILYNLYDY